MTKIVKYALIIAFVIFVAGIIWAVSASRDNKKDAATNPPANTPTLVGTPSSTTTPSATTTPTPAASPTPATAGSQSKKTPPKTRVVVIEETTTEVSASSWASAGTNDDGSSWAEAHAE